MTRRVVVHCGEAGAAAGSAPAVTDSGAVVEDRPPQASRQPILPRQAGPARPAPKEGEPRAGAGSRERQKGGRDLRKRPLTWGERELVLEMYARCAWRRIEAGKARPGVSPLGAYQDAADILHGRGLPLSLYQVRGQVLDYPGQLAAVCRRLELVIPLPGVPASADPEGPELPPRAAVLAEEPAADWEEAMGRLVRYLRDSCGLRLDQDPDRPGLWRVEGQAGAMTPLQLLGFANGRRQRKGLAPLALPEPLL